MKKRIALLLALCSSVPALADEPQARELTVFAATSLREPFEALAKDLQAETPGLTVRLNFAGSQELRAQIEQGARADVFASADQKHMAALEKTGAALAPRVFARNQPVVVVPRANPAKLARFADLPSAQRIVIGAPEVPIGNYTLQILDKAGADFKTKVLARVASKELNVRQVLAKIALGEGDAGVVYRSDALAAKDKVLTLEIPGEVNVVAAYPIAVLRDAPQAAAARAFVELVLSAGGQKRLAAAGFSSPSS